MACITCVWAGWDSVREQKKLEARKLLENAAESHTSGACFVRQPARLPEPLPKKTTPPTHAKILHAILIFTKTQKLYANRNAC